MSIQNLAGGESSAAAGFSMPALNRLLEPPPQGVAGAELDRRSLAMLALIAPLAAATGAASQSATPPAPSHDMSMAPASWSGHDQVAMLLYPRMTALDLIGPQYMFASLMGAKVHLVAKTRDPVTSDTGVTITPTATFDETPKDLTVLFAPGGTEGTLNALQDAETRAFMADRGSRAKYVTSVCTGSLILAAAGLLKGYKATSHWAAREALSDFGAIPTDARVVIDRNRITGAGVTAGLDFGLTMVAQLRDANYAQSLQLLCEYDPHPPFNAGSIHTAPPQVRAMMEGMLSPFRDQVRAAARRIAT
jgi:cyclohexyl-isocyanide hydratase